MGLIKRGVSKIAANKLPLRFLGRLERFRLWCPCVGFRPWCSAWWLWWPGAARSGKTIRRRSRTSATLRKDQSYAADAPSRWCTTRLLKQIVSAFCIHFLIFYIFYFVDFIHFWDFRDFSKIPVIFWDWDPRLFSKKSHGIWTPRDRDFFSVGGDFARKSHLWSREPI